ncbi:PLAT/LH2 domain-containing protein [Ditylenchus destructor]|nr:PLAT/LH2 domain-containing protein [Ditylenchus destructor]
MTNAKREANATAKEPSSNSPDSDSQGKCSYSVAVRTSCQSTSEEAGVVFIQLIDKHGEESDKNRLRYSLTHRIKFKAGHSDLFVLADQVHLDHLSKLKLWLQKYKKDEAWKLHSIMVIKHADSEHILYRFPCDKWIGLNTDSATVTEVCLDVIGDPWPVLHEEDFSTEIYD